MWRNCGGGCCKEHTLGLTLFELFVEVLQLCLDLLNAGECAGILLAVGVELLPEPAKVHRKGGNATLLFRAVVAQELDCLVESIEALPEVD